MLGTCCVTVLSDSVDPVLALHNVMRFYRHESCGQCTPCREGCGWIERILNKIVEGKGSIAELDEIHEIAGNITLTKRSAYAWYVVPPARWAWRADGDRRGMVDAAGPGAPEVGDTVVFGFRPQAFVTRGYTIGIAGLASGEPRVATLHDAFGRPAEF